MTTTPVATSKATAAIPETRTTIATTMTEITATPPATTRTAATKKEQQLQQ